MLNGDNAPGGETLAVTDAIHLENDRVLQIAWSQKIGMQGMYMTVFRHGTGGTEQGLSQHLTAVHAHPAFIFVRAAIEVFIQCFQLEMIKQLRELKIFLCVHGVDP
jgi:predicted esterase